MITGEGDALHPCGIDLNVIVAMSLQPKKSNALPLVVTEMLPLLGEENTQAMIKAFGGRRIRVPATEGCAGFAEIEQVIGTESTLLFCKAFGRVSIYIPKLEVFERAHRNGRMRQRFDELSRDLSGRKSIDLMVQEFGLSGRHIETIVNS